MQTPLSTLLNDKGSTTYCITTDKTVLNAVVEMRRLDIGALLVLEHDNLKGIISERDIVQKIIGCACDPAEMPVTDIMTKDLTTVTPSTTVQQAMHIVTEKRIRHLPVLENGNLVGLISIGDLTRWVMLAQEHDISSLKEYIQGGNNLITD